MESSKLPMRKWVYGIYDDHQSEGRVQRSSTAIGILVHGPTSRQGLIDDGAPLVDEVEVDETYMGGREHNKRIS